MECSHSHLGTSVVYKILIRNSSTRFIQSRDYNIILNMQFLLVQKLVSGRNPDSSRIMIPFSM